MLSPEALASLMAEEASFKIIAIAKMPVQRQEFSVPSKFPLEIAAWNVLILSQ
jgi:hypothetical protein